MIWIVLLSDADLSTHTLTPEIQYEAFGVYLDLIGGEALASNQSLYLSVSLPRLHLNAFRGVRAISKFDWPFTPTLTSSRSFSTLIGADLHPVLPGLHPGQG